MDKEKKGERNAHSRILRCLTQLGHERFRRCPATPDAWKKAMSASRARQKDKLSLVFLYSIVACIAMFLRTTDLQAINVNLACVIPVKSLNSLVISGRFVMHFAEGSFSR